jgi:peptidoglycan hydrolase-like protein with peptidoglycan-binding domain
MIRRRGLATAAVVVVVLAAAGASTAAALGFGGADAGTTPHSALPPATAKVTRQTLVDREKASGTLDYGRETSVGNRLNGTVTALAEVGTVVKAGEVLYRVDNSPVVAMYGPLPLYRPLAPGTEGPDVKQFEQQLRALGYTGFTVDEKYTADTAAAVKRWQKKLGLDQTGVVDLGRVVFVPGEVRVAAHKVAVGDAAGPGGAVLTVTGTARVVTVKLEVSQQRLTTQSAKVAVDLPDGKRVDATITKVTTVVEPPTGAQTEAKTKLEVTLALADQAATAGLDQASVTAQFTAVEHKDVLTVPVAALLALAEGGYGVQVVEGDRTRVVAVQTGLFSGGRVEVSGGGLADGMTVGMPT